MQADDRRRFGRRASEFGVALTGVNVAEIEEAAGMKYRQKDAIAGTHVAYVEIAAPFALTVEAGADFAIRRDAKRTDERRDRPRQAVVEVQDAVVMAKNARGIVPRQFRPARRFA